MNTFPLKRLAIIKKGKLAEEKNDGLPLLDMEYLRKYNYLPKKVSQSGMVCAENGDILVLWDGSNAGEFIRAKKGVVGSTLALINIKSKKITPDFLYYTCKANEQYIKDLSIGMGIPHVSGNVLRNIQINIPSLEKQKEIIDSLDKKIKKINEIIKKKKTFIRLLSENELSYKENTYTNNSKKNDQIRRYADNIVDKIRLEKDMHGASNIIMLEDIEGWSARLVKISDNQSIEGDLLHFKKGDILFSKLRPYLAKAYLTEEDGYCSGEFLVIRPKKSLKAEYLIEYILSKKFIDEVNSATYGTKMPRASWEIIGGLEIPIFELKKQVEIADSTGKASVKNNKTKTALVRSIELLNEYRSSLIIKNMNREIV